MRDGPFLQTQVPGGNNSCWVAQERSVYLMVGWTTNLITTAERRLKTQDRTIVLLFPCCPTRFGFVFFKGGLPSLYQWIGKRDTHPSHPLGFQTFLKVIHPKPLKYLCILPTPQLFPSFPQPWEEKACPAPSQDCQLDVSSLICLLLSTKVQWKPPPHPNRYY